MQVHFSNVSLNSRSGPNTFAARLASELIKMGHSIVNSGDAYDTMLAFIEAGSNPRPGSRLVQRLDGIWFKPEDFSTKNEIIKWTYLRSKHVIFQSEFDRRMIEHHWGLPGSYSVIHNGIDLKKNTVTIDGIKNLRDSFDKIFVSSASWHRQKRLKENTELFLKLAGDDPGSCFVVMGRNPDHVVCHPRVFYVGEVDHSTCLQIYSVASWMIHLAWLDHCPNVVVEALSQGCPVICTDSGGTNEIVRDNGLIIPESKIYNFELLDYDDPFQLELSVKDLPSLKVKNDYLDIQNVAKNYEKALEGKE